jgi:hypothetical protein
MYTGLRLTSYFYHVLAKIGKCGGGVMKCNENWSGAKKHHSMHADGRTDMSWLRVAFYNWFANAPKNF